MSHKNQYWVKDLDHSTVSFKYYSRKQSEFSTSSKWKEFTASYKTKKHSSFLLPLTINTGPISCINYFDSFLITASYFSNLSLPFTK